MKNVLLFSEDRATLVMHSFIFLAYISAIPGGYIADALIGKYSTILYISVVYCLGSATLSVTSIEGVTVCATLPHHHPNHHPNHHQHQQHRYHIVMRITFMLQ
jgi:dipeptide/tripeptide permease